MKKIDSCKIGKVLIDRDGDLWFYDDKDHNVSCMICSDEKNKVYELNDGKLVITDNNNLIFEIHDNVNQLIDNTEFNISDWLEKAIYTCA